MTTPALSRPPPGRFVFGLHVAAGIEPAPGACAQLPAWWGRDHWLDVDVQCAVALGRDVCREEHVDPDTVKRVARGHARYADNATGRNCRPTNERVAGELGMSVRQVQRARRVLKRLRLLAEVVRGRSILTRAERLAAWRRGSSHRRLAATFALLSIRHAHPAGCPVERVTPPGHPRRGLARSPNLRVLPGEDRRTSRAAPGTHRQRQRTAPAGLREVKAQRLIAGVVARIGWLSRSSPRRLTILHRFAAHGWTPRDVHRALDEVLRARGWSVPDHVEHPAAYLACLLRDVDPADRPGALEEAMLAEEFARREWLWQTQVAGAACEHGHPAGNVPHPVSGHVVCLECRTNSRHNDANNRPE